jgi:hypothetical protein
MGQTSQTATVTLLLAIPFTYTVTGIDGNGCINTATVLVKANTCPGFAEMMPAQNLISVFPNPANGEIYISAASPIKLIVFNELGQHVNTIVIEEKDNYKAKISNLSPGVYLLTGQNEFGKVKEKIVITR